MFFMSILTYTSNPLVIAMSFLVVLAGTIGSYYSGLSGPFVFDDLTNILLPPALKITTLDFNALKTAAFWEQNQAIGRPIAMLSFALNYYFGGLAPLGYKVVNLVIHLINGAAIYWLTFSLAQRVPAGHLNNSKNAAHWLALAVSATWLLHPLNLTSVLYVVQRMTSLATFFILLGLLGYLWGRKQLRQDKAVGFVTISLSLLLGTTLSVVTKEIGVLLPAYALLIELVLYRFNDVGRFSSALRKYWGTLTSLGVAAIVTAIAVYPEKLLSLLNYQYRDFTLTERLLTESRALWFYIKSIFLPNIADLGLYHDDFPISTGLATPPTTAIALAGLAILLVLAFVFFRRAPILAFGIAWFLVGHSIESTIIPLELIHEHRNYLPQYGLLFALIYYLTYPTNRLHATLGLRRGVAVLYIVLLGLSTYSRATDWGNELTLYQREVQHHPQSASVRTALGILLHDNRHYDLAEEQFIAAAQLSPQDSKPLIRLAQHVYIVRGKISPEILGELEHRMLAYPYSGITLWTYEALLKATLSARQLNFRLVQIFERTLHRPDIELNSDWREYGFRTLGFAYRELGKYKRAITYFHLAAQTKPLADHYLVLAEMYAKIANITEAKRTLSVLSTWNGLGDKELTRMRQIEASINSKTKNSQ